MADQRNGDKNILKGGAGETVGRSVEQPDNNGGVVYQKGLKVGDQKNPKLGYGAPRFVKWNGLHSNIPGDAESIYIKDTNRFRFSSTLHGEDDDLTRTRLCGVSIFNEAREFGRDTNRLDLFSVRALNLHGDDDDLTTSTDYGGGGRLGGGDNTHEVAVLEPDRSREIQPGDVATNGNVGGEVVVKQEKDSGKKRIGGDRGGWWEKWCCCCHCGK